MALRRIIHISDLHFSEKEDSKSLLQNQKYADDWFESLREIEAIDTLVISGDIVNQGGSERAYEKVNTFIKRIRKELKIEHILCVPGNHDRNLLIGISGRADVNPDRLWEYCDEKLKYYWNFMKKNKINIQGHSGLVSSLILSGPNMIILGLDSTDRIGIKDEYGFVNVEKLEEALADIFGPEKEAYSDYIKVAVLHHRPIIYESASQRVTDNNSSEIGQYGTCDSENWEKVKKILLDYDVHYVLTGHVHGSQSGQVRSFESENDQINYSTVGSIGVDFSKELIGRLDKAQNQDFLDNLKNLKCYASLNGNHNAYNVWTFDDEGLIREEQYKYIIDEGKRRWCYWGKKDFGKIYEHIDSSNIFDTEAVTLPTLQEEHENYEEMILECVRTQGLYKTGHYHWKNSARLNWIDTSYFFGNREMMFHIAKGINNLFEKKKSLQDVDCIIGLGIKGSIMLSYVRFLFPDKKCSYLPENKKEYNHYETALFDEKEEFKSIAVLTDVVHTGSTIKEFANEIFEKTKKFLNIKVVTIFDVTPDGNIARVERKAKFELFYLARLKVTDCPRGGESCDIYLKKLANVIEYKED